MVKTSSEICRMNIFGLAQRNSVECFFLQDGNTSKNEIRTIATTCYVIFSTAKCSVQSHRSIHANELHRSKNTQTRNKYINAYIILLSTDFEYPVFDRLIQAIFGATFNLREYIFFIYFFFLVVGRAIARDISFVSKLSLFMPEELILNSTYNSSSIELQRSTAATTQILNFFYTIFSIFLNIEIQTIQTTFEINEAETSIHLEPATDSEHLLAAPIYTSIRICSQTTGQLINRTE